MIFFNSCAIVCVVLCVVGGWLSPMSTDSRFLFTENVQFSYVSLRCTSSGQRTRSRHGRKAGEEDGSSITAEFELDVNLEEVTGWSLCAPSLPACEIRLLLSIFLSLLSVHQNIKVSPVLTLPWSLAIGWDSLGVFVLFP